MVKYYNNILLPLIKVVILDTRSSKSTVVKRSQLEI